MNLPGTRSARVAVLAAVAILPALNAAALPPSAESLSLSARVLENSGFAGLQDVAVPAAAASPAPASAPADPTQEALAGLIALAQAQPESNGGISETARALGFDFTGAFVHRALDMVPTPEAKHFFSIATLRGETVVVVEVYSRSARELRSFRASASGVLQAAALTTKPNGVFVATEIVLPDAEASRTFAAEVDFWTRYYRDHPGH